MRELGAQSSVTAIVRRENRRLVEIRYAGAEGPSCDELPPGGELVARGNRPFWHVQVRGHQATVTMPEALDGIVYREGRWSRTED